MIPQSLGKKYNLLNIQINIPKKIMKKLFVYRINNNIFFNLFRIKIHQILGYQVYIWGEHKFLIKNSIQIKFPSAIKSVDYEKESRQMVADYFTKFSKFYSNTNIHSLDYVRKNIDIYALDYFAFEKTISKLITGNDEYKKIAPPLLSTIHAGLPMKRNYWIFFYYPILILQMTMMWLKDLVMSFLINEKVSITPILYYRKKASIDGGEYDYFCKKLNKNNKILIRGIFPFSGKKKKLFGFYFFNSFQKSNIIATKAYVSSIKSSFADIIFYFKSGIDISIFKKCVTETYTAKKIVGLSPSILLGILVDKPLYILMYKYKKDFTRIVSLNESFFFSPNRSFDYNHLDLYFSMNSIDEKMQNKYGGKIKSFHQVEFFRKGNHELKGITENLSKILPNYKYKIVIAPAQVFVEKTGYYYWAYDEMEIFLKTSMALAKDFQDTLFIVKGKKGELKLLPSWFQDMEMEMKNIFVVHCDKPKELEYNKFEDLISIADISISMALTSTTIWQSIARNKPAIAINRTDTPSPLSKFRGFECDIVDLKKNIEYWRSCSKTEIYNSVDTLKSTFNIGSSNGLEDVSKKLVSMLEVN